MFIYVRHGTEGVREADAGMIVCPNCNCEAHMSLFREVGYVNLYAVLPIWRNTKRKGLLCENCGHLEELSDEEYEHFQRKFPLL